MKALFYQCHCGISGDMNLAALIDVGVPADYLREQLNRLPMADEFELLIGRDQKQGLWGTRVAVELIAGAGEASAHRHYSAIRALINATVYTPSVKAIAQQIFRGLAEAEAKIHDMALDDVHFHELGAVDSIVDIVGAAIGLDYLRTEHGVEAVLCGPVELGDGQVRCAHGLLPVPAPATAELLRDAPCQLGGVDGEATTPTGAAILQATVNEYLPTGIFTPLRIGYGVGHKDFSRPNLLRLMLGSYQAVDGAAATAPLPAADHYEIVTNIDDMSAEAFQPLLERLLAEGASDAFLTPVVMKKGRLAQMVTVLCTAPQVDLLANVLTTESSTIGVRIRPVWKRMLSRTEISVATAFGMVSVKIVTLPDGSKRWKLEHDDVQALAGTLKRPYPELRRDLEQAVAAVIQDDLKAAAGVLRSPS